MHTIRPATAADNDGLRALEQRCAQGGTITVYHVRDDYQARSRQYGEAPTCAHWVCVGDRDDIAGAIAAIVRRQAVGGEGGGEGGGEVVPVLYVFDVRVDPGYRRRGVARALVEHAIAQARDTSGCQVVTGWIEGENEPSLRLFEGMGFHRARTQVVPVVALAPHAPKASSRFDVRWAEPGDTAATHGADAGDAWPLEAPAMCAYRARERFVLEGATALDAHPAYRGRVLVTDTRSGAAVSARLWDPTSIRRIAFERMPVLAHLARPLFALGALVGLSPRMPWPHRAFDEWFIYDCRLYAQDTDPTPDTVRRLGRALWTAARRRVVELTRGTGRMPIGLHAPMDADSPLWEAQRRGAMHVAEVVWVVRAIDDSDGDPAGWEGPVNFDPRDF